MNHQVGIKLVQLKLWMFGSSWNQTIATRRTNECIKLELNNSNWWIVIEPKDRRIIVEQNIDLLIELIYYMKIT